MPCPPTHRYPQKSPRGPAETKGPKDPAALLCRMPVGSRFNHVHARAPSFSSRVDQARRKPPSPQSPTKDRFAMIPSYCVINGVAQLADLALPEVRCSFGEQHYGRRKGWKEIPEANSKMSKEETMKERAPRSTAKRGGYRPAYSRPRKAEGMIMRATFVLVPRREGRVWERRRVLYIFIFCGQVGAGCTRDLLAVDKFNSHSNSRDRRQQNRGNLTFQAFNFWSRDASRTRKARDPQ
ncbi:hypothetical protein OOU_Y34scaffold00514g24 [Pyricularia oryzae Y34]|uniref:Uncharacterized protein n=2 Tax=Pyricularia oryzae TaxID=318829 RepID=A0AA97PLJ3_PYRO3|nr:hypothetical protein OOU_Y34scaffold00514g24 [Pyricularia oryzae Y34]